MTRLGSYLVAIPEIAEQEYKTNTHTVRYTDGGSAVLSSTSETEPTRHQISVRTDGVSYERNSPD